jgi:hypothetical protein
MTTNSKGGFVRTLESACLDTDALVLRSTGMTFREIADEMCCDVSTAHRRVKRALADIPKEQADEYRALELLRLDELQVSLWNKAIEGDYKALDRVLTIIRQRGRLLGLEVIKPQEQQIQWPSPEVINSELNRARQILKENGF